MSQACNTPRTAAGTGCQDGHGGVVAAAIETLRAAGYQVPRVDPGAPAKAPWPAGGDLGTGGLDEASNMAKQAALTGPRAMMNSAQAKAFAGVRDLLARSGRKSSKNGVKIDLPIIWSFTTSPGTTYTNVRAINPFDSGEYSSLAALYDEVIVDGGSLKLIESETTAYANPTTQFAVIAFDPINTAVIGSLANGVQHTQHTLWHHAAVPANCTPRMISRDGIHHWRWRTPKGVARSLVSTAAFGHEWSSTIDTSAAYGYLKPYILSPGTTGVHDVIVIITLHCRFRSRS